MTINELIAEARARANNPQLGSGTARCLRALADTLEAAQVPEGWMISEYSHDKKGAVGYDNGQWRVAPINDDWGGIEWVGDIYSTHLAAIAAVEKDHDGC